ncbi:MAG: ATP-grasp domain-containing protein [Planctomycetes bacterium]|nr:ATP-grasp domain-containing protein [Planctomycetota bacterium]
MKREHKRVLLLSFVTRKEDLAVDLASALKTPEWQSESDIARALKRLGHEVDVCLVCDEVEPVAARVREWKPDIVFNLVDEFRGKSVNDWKIASYLELLGVPYTGCGPRGLLLSKDKELAKKVLRPHRIRVPDCFVCEPGTTPRKPTRLQWPLIVKTLYEEGSVGIAQASIVNDEAQLKERVDFIHRTFTQPALAEEFIEGREIYVSILGNERIRVFPLREIRFGTLPAEAPRIASFSAKWDEEYRKRWGINNEFATDLPPETVRRIVHLARRTARALNLDGYARLDLRLPAEGAPVLLEANPNPFLARKEDFALSAEASGLGFVRLISRVLKLGFARVKC